MKVTLDYIPENCSENAVVLEKLTAKYVQNPDCCSDKEAYQELTIETRNNGVGNFYNIKTGEHGWSIDDSNTIAEIIEDFRQRLELNTVGVQDLRTYGK